MKTRFLHQLRVLAVLCVLLGRIVSPVAAQAPPEIASSGQPIDQSASLEADVLFSVRAVGEAPLNYQWRYEGNPLTEATGPTYAITQVQPQHAGGYDVVVANQYGSITSRVATLTIDPTFTKLREGPLFPMLEDRANFSGAAWGDYDSDGDLDLYVVTDCLRPGNHLYHNLLNETGEAVFSRASAEVSANDQIAGGVSVAWADYDNDGDLDLLVGGWEQARLFQNEGHLLRHLLSVGPDCVESAAWADLDNDGLLDMNVSVWFSGCPAGASSSSLFYRNQGEAAFGLVDNPWRDQANAITSTWSDYDGDGDMDLFAANADSNRLWINQGDGLFRLELESPISQSEAGWAGAWADLDNDGRLDLYLATGAGQSRRNLLYWNDGPAGFTVVTNGPPVDELKDAHGVAIGDYDNDGFLDIYVANKAGSDNRDSLYRNLGGRQFHRMTTGSPVNERIDSKTPCWVDFDNDGDLDLFVASGIRGGPALCQNVFYLNNGNDNHWIRIRCVGGQRPDSTFRLSNRDGIGAKVRLEAVIRGETVWQMREITGGPGVCYSQPLEAHFGLGDATRIETLLVEWPSGMVQVSKDLPVDSFLVVEEPPILLAGLSFSEGGSLSTFNFGSLAGCGAIIQQDGFPVYSPNVPVGPWAPVNNRVAMDFGVIADGQGGRAIDLHQTCGAVEAFTVAGWLNARDLRAGTGGNRVLCALSAPDAPGFELVQWADGSLQLGVNQAAELSPVRSAAARITEDAAVAADNWVFFAVAYDGTQPTGNAQFYFGTANQAAQPDAAAIDYDRGMMAGLECLTVGNLSLMADGRDDTGPTGCRGFRGLVDEIKMFATVLDLEEIQAAQQAPARRAAFIPVWSVRHEDDELVIEWDAARTFQLQQCSDLNRLLWRNVRPLPEVEGFRHTCRRPIGSTTRQLYYRLLGY